MLERNREIEKERRKIECISGEREIKKKETETDEDSDKV